MLLRWLRSDDDPFIIVSGANDLPRIVKPSQSNLIGCPSDCRFCLAEKSRLKARSDIESEETSSSVEQRERVLGLVDERPYDIVKIMMGSD